MSIMDVKISEKPNDGEKSQASQNVKRKSLFLFIQEMKDEMKKVSWTSKEELRFSTKLVILSMFIFGFSVYLVDFIVKGFLEAFKTAVHFIFG